MDRVQIGAVTTGIAIGDSYANGQVVMDMCACTRGGGAAWISDIGASCGTKSIAAAIIWRWQLRIGGFGGSGGLSSLALEQGAPLENNLHRPPIVCPRVCAKMWIGVGAVGGIPSLSNGRRHVGQACWRSSQLRRHRKWNTCAQGSRFARSLPAVLRMSSRHTMHVLSDKASTSAALSVGYAASRVRMARWYRRTSFQRLKKDAAVR